MLFAALLIAKQFSERFEVEAASEQQLALGTRVVQSLTRYQQMGFDEDKSIRRANQRGKRLIVVFDKNSKQINMGFPRPLAPHANRLKDYLDLQSPVVTTHRNTQFLGPFDWTSEQGDKSVFVGKLMPRGSSDSQTFALVYAGIGAAMLGSLFCFVLVWNLTKPIKQISKASRLFALGKLNSRVSGLDNRQDELGKLGEDFNQMAVKIETILNSQKVLMANVSHELRTPLTRMQLAIALIENALKDGQEIHNKAAHVNLQRLERDIQKMDAMIHQVLNIAKISTDNSKLRLQMTPIVTIVQDLIDDSNLESNSLNVSIELVTTTDIALPLDHATFSSALENILRNALRYAKTNVRVCLNEVLVDGICTLYISVEDDGVGIPTQQLQEIFEPFYRAQNPDNNQHEGAGLGLAIAKAAIEAHKGKISAESSTLGGLKVVIRIALDISSQHELNKRI